MNSMHRPSNAAPTNYAVAFDSQDRTEPMCRRDAMYYLHGLRINGRMNGAHLIRFSEVTGTWEVQS